MENFIKRIPTVLSLFLFCFGSCDSNDDSDTAEKVLDSEEITSMITAGIWKVSSYVNDSVDETANYTNYAFTFNDGGVLAADNGEDSSASGAWIIANPSTGEITLRVFFSSPDELVEISDTWKVYNSNSTNIEVSDDGTNDSGNKLSFQKN